MTGYWRWAVRQLTFAQLPTNPFAGEGRRGRGSRQGSGDTRSAAWRDRHAIIGGYAYDPPNEAAPIGGLSPASAVYDPNDRFDPYRGGDLQRIIQNQVQNGSIDDLQLAMIRAGLIDEGDIVLGYADDTTTDAFEQVLALANQNAMDWRDVMSQVGQGAFGNIGPGERQLPPDIVTLPNREDILYTTEKTSMDMTGHKLDDDLVEGAADGLLNALRTQQERQYQKEISMGELNFTEDMPGERGQQRILEEEIKKRAPQLVAERGAQTARDIWFEGLAGPVG